MAWNDFRAPQDIPMYGEPEWAAPAPAPSVVESLGASPYGAPAPSQGGFWGGRGMWGSLRGGMQGGMYQAPGARGVGYRMGYGGMRRPVAAPAYQQASGRVGPAETAPTGTAEAGGTLQGTKTRLAPGTAERPETMATTMPLRR